MTKTTLTAIAMISDEAGLEVFRKSGAMTLFSVAALEVVEAVIVLSTDLEVRDGAYISGVNNGAFTLKRDKGLLAKVIGNYTFNGAIDAEGEDYLVIELDFTARGAFGGVGQADIPAARRPERRAPQVRAEDRALLKALGKKGATLNGLAKKLDITPQQAWHSLNRLRAAGLASWTPGEFGSYRAA